MHVCRGGAVQQAPPVMASYRVLEHPPQSPGQLLTKNRSHTASPCCFTLHSTLPSDPANTAHHRKGWCTLLLCPIHAAVRQSCLMLLG